MDKRDANEASLIRFWKSCGCIVVKQDRHAGFDLLLIDRSGLYIVEIKNPDGNWHLTPAEFKMQDAVENIGGQYHIITTLKEAGALIGLEVT